MAVLTSWIIGPSWGDGSYTADQMGTGKSWPKLKFNFTMSAKFRQGAPDNTGSDDMEQISIPLKNATRPNLNVNYQEYAKYGFRSRTQTKIEYGSITVTLYDDVSNSAHNFIMSYLRTLSPLAQTPRSQASSLENILPSSVTSMTNRHGILDHIRISHHYMASGEPKVTHYDYLNPKIQNVTFDELDMGASDPNTVSFTFLFDGFDVVEE